MEANQISNHDKHKMIDALNDFKRAVQVIGDLWDSEDGSGVTPFDSILEKHYPFKHCFFFTQADIDNWVDNAVDELKKL